MSSPPDNLLLLQLRRTGDQWDVVLDDAGERKALGDLHALIRFLQCLANDERPPPHGLR